jgi:molybdopterin adenylyltransferase
MNGSPPPTASLAGRTAIVITASDRCHAGLQTDLSGPAVATLLTQAGAQVLDTLILPDDLDMLTTALRTTAPRCHLLVTTGGTGLSARDVTPEATMAICDRLVPGIPEIIRQDGLRQTPFSALGRGVCGVYAHSLILNLPGSPQGASSSLRAVLHLLPHAIDLITGQTDHPVSHPQP